MSEPDPFALCLTHDVDRPLKTYHWLYEAAMNRDVRALFGPFSESNPYWMFDEIMDLERNLGVRSSFYFLTEKHLFKDLPPWSWFLPRNWLLYLGRYDVRSSEMSDVITRLDEGDWEVGLHGSFGSYRDVRRLRYEKRVLESVLGHPVRGVRQHYLNRSTLTWKNQRQIGLKYDATLGHSQRTGFNYGYRPLRPFEDEFLVFPLTAMEISLPDPGENFSAAWDECERLLQEAAEHGAVMTVLWHVRYFSESEFPGYRRLYRRLVERALEMGAWVGSLGDLYKRLQSSETSTG